MIEHNIFKMKNLFLFSLTALYINGMVTTISALEYRGMPGRKTNYTVEGLINTYGYQVETHSVITTDGYILKLHRIPIGKSKNRTGRVAFLMHGFLLSSADWIVAGPEHSLAFALAEAGYDVWLGNARGNTESRRHVTLDPDRDGAFCQFSWHEIGIIDVPQMIDYVLHITHSEQVYYAGHSQGTTTYFVMTSMLPEYNSKIKVQVSMAPGGYINHMTSPLLRFLATWTGPLEKVFNLIGYNEFSPSNELLQYILGHTICQEDAVTRALCSNIVFAIFGFSRQQFNETLLPLVLEFTPAGSSATQLIHWGQILQSGHFRQYDHGLSGNLLKYGSFSPPSYNLTKITAPTYFIYGLNDWICSVKDVDRTCKEMTGCLEQMAVTDENWNHIDFIYAIDNYKLVYTKVLDLFERYH